MDRKRLINAYVLNSELIERQYRDQTMGILHSPYPHLRAIVANQPTVDAVEVVHGQWIPLEYDGYADGNPVWDLWECSKCGEEHSGDEDTLTHYCPNCGAKMDEERSNQS